jgi:protease I
MTVEGSKMTSVNGRTRLRVAILVENNFEDSEFQIPYTALNLAGIETVVVGSRMNDEYKGKQGKVTLTPSATATEVRAEDFEAIVIPGGAAPDRIRTNPNAVNLVREAMDLGTTIAAVCHGPQVLIEAERLRGKRATGFLSIRKDLENAGADYVNEPLVVDRNLITSRQPGDLPIFTNKILNCLGVENVTRSEANKPPSTKDALAQNYEWWKLGEAWGGSSRSDIVKALNSAITGEYYTAKTFENYAVKISDRESRSLLEEIYTIKQANIAKLETRLAAFNEQLPWLASSRETYANLQNLVQSNDDVKILRKALGEVQTSVINIYNLAIQLTDPITVAIFMDVEASLSKYEIHLGNLYRARLGKNPQPPIPTAMTLARVRWFRHLE